MVRLDTDLEVLTVAQVAKLLHKHADTVIKWIKSGKLPASRVGERGQFMIAKSDVIEAIGYNPDSGKERQTEEE